MMTHTSNFTSFQSFQSSSFVFILLRIFKKKNLCGFYKLISFLNAVLNHLVRMLMVVLVVIKIGIAHIRPLEVVSILIGALEVNFTAWSNLTVVENRLIGKAIAGLVINHIEFVHIRSLYVVSILIGVLKWILPGWIWPRSKTIWLERQYSV